MATELLFGTQTNGIKHAHADPMPDIDTRFRKVAESRVFDYGEGCRYSLFEQAVACVEWMRAEWDAARAPAQ